MGRTEKSEEGVAGEDFGLNCDEKEGALWTEDQRKQEKIGSEGETQFPSEPGYVLCSGPCPYPVNKSVSLSGL